MKRLIICYYSGTGNTKRACQYIKKHLDDVDTELFDIAAGVLPVLDEYDFVGFATFTDWNDAPYLMEKFIGQLERQKDKPAFVFNTCAGFRGRTLRTMQESLREKGFKVLAGFTLRAPENYPPAVAKGKLVEHFPTPRNLDVFNDDIRQLNLLVKKASYEDLPEIKIKVGLINLFLPRFPRDKSKKSMGPKYVDQSLCNLCGTCKKVCPYQAIEIVEGPIFNESKCYGCWSCFNHCSQKAIYTGNLRGKGHYSKLPDLYLEKMGID